MNGPPYKASLGRRLLSYFSPQRIVTKESAVSSALEITLENGRTVLNTAKVNYSYGSLQQVFRMAFNACRISSRKLNRVLVLGFGVGSVAAILFDEMKKTTRLTGVECDPVVIAAGRKYFNTTRFTGMQLENNTAENFVAGCRDHFDMVVVDVFVEDHVPATCTSKAFLHDLAQLLEGEKMLFFNFIVTDETRSQYEELKSGFHELFPDGGELQFHLNGADNRILVSKKCDRC